MQLLAHMVLLQIPTSSRCLNFRVHNSLLYYGLAHNPLYTKPTISLIMLQREFPTFISSISDLSELRNSSNSCPFGSPHNIRSLYPLGTCSS